MWQTRSGDVDGPMEEVQVAGSEVVGMTSGGDSSHKATLRQRGQGTTPNKNWEGVRDDLFVPRHLQGSGYLSFTNVLMSSGIIETTIVWRWMFCQLRKAILDRREFRMGSVWKLNEVKACVIWCHTYAKVLCGTKRGCKCRNAVSSISCWNELVPIVCTKSCVKACASKKVISRV